MRKKGIAILVMVTGLLLSNAFTSLAAWEQSGAGWKYKDDTTGAYDRNGWYWIDGNSDRIAECYYFDDTEIMAANTVIDNYTINEEGQWTVDGVVQTKMMEAAGIKELQVKDEVKNCLTRPFTEILPALQNPQKYSSGLFEVDWDENGNPIHKGYYYFTADNIPFTMYVYYTGDTPSEYPTFIRGTLKDIFNGVKEEYTFSEFKSIVEKMGITNLKATDKDYSYNLADFNGSGVHTVTGHTTQIEFKKDGLLYAIEGRNGKFYLSDGPVKVQRVE